MWIKTLAANGFIRFEFDSLRSPILKQASLTQGFIPENGKKVFYELDCPTEKLLRFYKGTVDIIDEC